MAKVSMLCLLTSMEWITRWQCYFSKSLHVGSHWFTSKIESGILFICQCNHEVCHYVTRFNFTLSQSESPITIAIKKITGSLSKSSFSKCYFFMFFFENQHKNCKWWSYDCRTPQPVINVNHLPSIWIVICGHVGSELVVSVNICCQILFPKLSQLWTIIKWTVVNQNYLYQL